MEEQHNQQEPTTSVMDEGVKVFVNHLPPSMGESAVLELLGEYGPLTMVELVRDRFTQEPRGCAFAVFATSAGADAAAAALHGRRTLAGETQALVVRRACAPGTTQFALESAPRLRGEPGRLAHAPDQPLKLYIGHIPEGVTEEQLRPLFEPFGQVLEVVVLRQNGASRGCGFVHYARADAAYAAIDALHGKCRLDETQPELVLRVADAEKRAAQNPLAAPAVVLPGAGGAPSASGAAGTSSTAPPPLLPAPVQAPTTAPAPAPAPAQVPAPGLGYLGRQRQGPPGANLFVRNIPRDFGEGEMRMLFERFGEVLSTKVVADPQTNQSRGFGFVSFADPACAQHAIQALDGETVNGRVIGVALKAAPGTLGGAGPGARPF